VVSLGAAIFFYLKCHILSIENLDAFETETKTNQKKAEQ